MWIIPVSMVIYRKDTSEDDFTEMHNGDYDLIAFMFVAL
jgi:hypothetical protein